MVYIADRCAFEAAGIVESVQWKLIQCLQYLVELLHPDQPRKFSQCLQLLVNLRNLSEQHHKNRKEPYEDYALDILKSYPLICEALGESMTSLKTWQLLSIFLSALGCDEDLVSSPVYFFLCVWDTLYLYLKRNLNICKVNCFLRKINLHVHETWQVLYIYI